MDTHLREHLSLSDDIYIRCDKPWLWNDTFCDALIEVLQKQDPPKNIQTQNKMKKPIQFNSKPTRVVSTKVPLLVKNRKTLCASVPYLFLTNDSICPMQHKQINNY